jgi:putative ABC transport system permease protein
MYPIAQDLRYGVRLFSKTPSIGIIAVLALALGSGASTAIFSVVDAALWKPLPYRGPKSLLVIWEKNPALNRFRMFVAPANLPAWQQNRSLEGMAAVMAQRINLTGGPNGHIEPEELRAERVSAGLFSVLGVQPALGRAFQPDEDVPGHTDFVLLSNGLWQRRFGGDNRIVGKSIRLRDQSYQVVGVLPAGISVLDPLVDVWLPLGLNPYDPRAALARTLMVVARLKPDVPLEKARAEMEGIGARLERANPALNSGWRPALYPFRDELVGKTQKALEIIMAAVGLLILMACANVANLLLARGAARQKELAVRVALGASRARVVTQLLSESVLLSLAGGAAGLVLARLLLVLLSRLGATSIPRIAEARFDVRMFLFAVGISLLSGLLFGIVPAIQGSAGGLRAALAAEGRGGTAGRSGRVARNLLVVAEVALAVVVLIAAGLLLRSFVRLRATNPGFQPDSVLTFRLPLGGGRNTAPERRAPFLDQVAAKLSALPGARSIGAVDALPLTGLGVGASFALEGHPEPPPGRRPLGLMRSVTTGYFRTMGIPLVAGRGFADSDTPQSSPVAIVDQSLARRFSPDASLLGSHLTLDQAARRVVEIVGVVGEVKPDRMDGDAWPTIYLPYAQRPLTSMTFALRTARPPLTLALAVEREIHRLDPDQPVTDVKPMDQVVGNALAEARFDTVLLAGFAEIAFLLCAVGIYGVISYDTTQRTREIGIRMALGAQARDVRRLIVRQGAWLAGCGIALGLAAALALTRLMASMLYGVKPSDFPTFAVMAALLGAVALLASYLPSRRAMALDPVAALRHE